MKLRVSGKDLVIFSIFCVFLLYFSAVAVLNVFTLLNDGEFYGFLPFEAFTVRYIGATLLVFFAILIAVFASISSSIFERKSGIGIEVKDKEEKGYSRWLKEKEMKKGFNIVKVGIKDDHSDAAGVVIINDGKNMWVDNGEFHTLVIGVTGSGKTSAVVDPLTYSLIKHGESMIFTDPKGEIYKSHGELLKAKGYKLIVLNFRDPQNGNAWNPLHLPYVLYHEGKIDKATELIDDIASNIIKEKNAQDPFWQNSASDYFAGCALGLMEDAKEEEVNISSINFMTTVGDEKFGAGSDYIKEYFKLKGETSNAYIFANTTINSPSETKGGILSTFRSKIRIFSSQENLSEMLSYSDFNMRDIGREKTAVFMIIHDEKTTYHALATIFIKQCYETLISVAQENGGKLPVRTNFILDEFANMPALKDVTTMVTAARSRLIRFTFIIQNFAQLNDVYGKDDAETIRSNCGNLIYILTTELAALEEISKLCGEVKSKKEDKTESHPLVTISDLQKMKVNEVIVLRNRMHPFKTLLVQAFTVDWGDREFGKAELPVREKKEIQFFDLKEFVKVRKRSKMGMEEKGGTPSPFGGMGMPELPGFMGGANNAPKIPTFEEFMAARNGNKLPEVPKKPQMPSFDVDDLVKRIDAKIAELEAQEKEELAKNPSENSDKSILPNMPTPDSFVKDNMPTGLTPKVAKEDEVNSEIPVVKDEVLNEKETPVAKVLDTASIKEIKEENSIGFNPFNEERKIEEVKFIDKDVIDSIENPIETTPITPPKIDIKEETPKEKGDKIERFEDLLNQPVPEKMPEQKPSIMITNDSTKEFLKPEVEEIKLEEKNENSKVDMPEIKIPTSGLITPTPLKPDDNFFDDFFDADE